MRWTRGRLDLDGGRWCWRRAGGEAHARAKHATARDDARTPRATAKPSAAAGGGSACTDSDETALWWSPQAPAAGATIKLLAVGEESGAGELIGDRSRRRAARAHRGPPPGRPRQRVGGAGRAARGRLPGDLDARRPDARLPDDRGRCPRAQARHQRREGGLAGDPRLGPPLRELLLGLDRRAFRRAAGRLARLPPAASGAARSGA